MIQQKVFISYIFLGLLSIFSVTVFTACEEEFIPETSTDPPEIVVEGYIEAGEEGLPPYVLLTRSLPYFSEINLEKLDSLYVHDAFITVSDDEKSVTLTEICWNDLSPVEQELVKQILADLGVGGLENVAFNFCVYVDLDFSMIGEIGKRYDLKIEVEGQTLTASTTIPEHVPLEYVKFQRPPGTAPDSLMELITFIKDPPNQANFYRYFTAVNSEPLLAPFSSVFHDQIFDGQDFEFPLSKAEPLNEHVDHSAYGYFTLGDTVTLKWTTIDQEHFDFWNTLEFNRINQGPFSSYTKVDFNIVGGIGIWGGYSSSYYNQIVSE
jgi:Domain of unknown function (DUF4249)